MSVGDAVVPLELHIRVDEPVKPQGDILQNTSVDPPVVQVQVVIPEADLPRPVPELVRCALLALDPVGILARDDAVEEGRLANVGAVLTGQEVQELDVATGIEEGPYGRLAGQERIVGPMEVVFRIDGPRSEHVHELEVEVLLATAAAEDTSVRVEGPDAAEARALRAADPVASQPIVVAALAGRDAQMHDPPPLVLVEEQPRDPTRH